jgi:hypothetical protein
MGEEPKLSDLEVLAALEELEYPVSKQHLIAEAEARGSSQNFLEDLQALDRMWFADHQDVEAALQKGSRIEPR